MAKKTPPRPLGAGAVVDAVERGFVIGSDGRMSKPTEIGPCTKCQEACVRYGPNGSPRCAECRRGGAAPATTTATPTGDLL